jgi:hypothetical protein
VEQQAPSPVLSEFADDLSNLSGFDNDDCAFFTETLNLDPPKGLFSEYTLGYMGTPPERLPHIPAKRISNDSPQHTVVPEPPPQPATPQEPKKELPDMSTVIASIKKGMGELSVIRKRVSFSPNVQLQHVLTVLVFSAKLLS